MTVHTIYPKGTPRPNKRRSYIKIVWPKSYIFIKSTGQHIQFLEDSPQKANSSTIVNKRIELVQRAISQGKTENQAVKIAVHKTTKPKIVEVDNFQC